jgi:multidrug efflux pump subunit AcrA (membrane-fusion protein)
MALQAAVPAIDVPELAIGMAVDLTIDGFGERRFTGKIARINPTTEAGTRAILVCVGIPNPDRSLRGAMFATTVTVGSAVLGPFAYARLRVEQRPGVSLPFVLVPTEYPGASPEVVATDVTKPLEYATYTVSGVKLIRSTSREGRSEVFAEFRIATDMMPAIQDVRDAIAQVRPRFPRDV